MAPDFNKLFPMLLQESSRPFNSPEFVFELKFDGYRLLAEVDDGCVSLRTRHGTIATQWFPELVKSLETLPPGRHVLDGEACVLDGIGRSDFERLQNRARRRCWYKGCDLVTFCAFDLLVHSGQNVMALSLIERKARLAPLVKPCSSTLFVGHFEEDGTTLFHQASALELEGIVAKRKDSIYLPGERSTSWMKVKRPGWNEGRSWRN